MTCPKCGAQCIDGSTFCIKCGANMKEISNENVASIQSNVEQQNQFVQQEQPIQQQINDNQQAQQVVQQPVYNNVVTNNTQTVANVSNAPLNYLMYCIAILLKPFKCFKEEENKLNNTKTSIIFSLIVSVAMMLITLFKSMISAIFTKSLDYSTFKMKTTVDFSNLKDLDYLSLIGKNLLIYAGIIAAIAFVYFLMTLLFKKNTNFIKLLSISATSVIPFVILGMIISPLLGKIWTPLSIVCIVIGAVYSILIFMNLVNDNITFNNTDTKIYFHLTCMSILGTAGYYVYMKLIMSGISSQISDIMDLFG